MGKIKVIGICAEGPARGKDTLYTLLSELDSKFNRFAFADALKNSLYYYVMDTFGWDSFKLTPEQKEIIRPIWIAAGEAARKIDPLYWVKKTYEDVTHPEIPDGIIPVLTDVRYANEAIFFKEKFGDAFLLVEVFVPGAPKPPLSEQLAFPHLVPLIDQRINWPDSNGDLNVLRPYAKSLYQDIILK